MYKVQHGECRIDSLQNCKIENKNLVLGDNNPVYIDSAAINKVSDENLSAVLDILSKGGYCSRPSKSKAIVAPAVK
jgi:hypothetical protein